MLMNFSKELSLVNIHFFLYHFSFSYSRQTHLGIILLKFIICNSRVRVYLFNFQKTYRSLRAKKPVDEQSWIIPLTYTKQSKPDFSSTKPKLWSFPGQELHLHDAVEAGEEWILFNVQATGQFLLPSF